MKPERENWMKLSIFCRDEISFQYPRRGFAHLKFALLKFPNLVRGSSLLLHTPLLRFTGCHVQCRNEGDRNAVRFYPYDFVNCNDSIPVYISPGVLWQVLLYITPHNGLFLEWA